MLDKIFLKTVVSPIWFPCLEFMFSSAHSGYFRCVVDDWDRAADRSKRQKFPVIEWDTLEVVMRTVI